MLSKYAANQDLEKNYRSGKKIYMLEKYKIV